MTTAFSIAVRVYYADTDAGGVVYHANYAAFFERARVEFMRAAGIDSQKMREEWKVLFAVRSMNMEFLRPALLDDLLDVDVRPEGRGRVYADFAQTASRNGEALATAKVRVVCVSPPPMRAVSLPPPLAEKIEDCLTKK